MSEQTESFETVKDFIATKKVSRSFFYKQIRAGKLAVHKFGRATRIAVSEGNRWAAANLRKPNAPSKNPSCSCKTLGSFCPLHAKGR